MENQCDYCFTVFKTKYILKRHIEESKKCLKLREKYMCKDCSHLCKTETELKDHLLTCKDHIINELKESHKQEINELKETINKLEQKIDSYVK